MLGFVRGNSSCLGVVGKFTVYFLLVNHCKKGESDWCDHIGTNCGSNIRTLIKVMLMLYRFIIRNVYFS